MDMVSREEHEAVKEMAAAARDDNERLEARIAALEAENARLRTALEPFAAFAEWMDERAEEDGDVYDDNLLMAVAIAAESGIDVIDIAAILPQLIGAVGRLEAVRLGQNFTALVDYAHSPEAVTRVLETAHEIATGSVIAVLGCGGDRDSSKRSLMGLALRDGADIAIYTSDNPRSEKPEDILVQMVLDIDIQAPNEVITDRTAAIRAAVNHATAGDVVIVLGKGHEKGQEISGVIHPFDDRIELARAIEDKK
jgi:UDP-N-acetylmuramoyl-L-alanyl-D-glutamate--2,6-diaminopimelate ligase